MTTDDNQSGSSFGEIAEREDLDNVEGSDNTEVSATQQPEATPAEATPEVAPETKVEEPQLTEKGTKLDPNPQSALHQQLANERRVRSQMEQVLRNKELLAQYMKQQFGDIPQQEVVKPVESKKYTAQDFENLEDVANVVNSLNESFATKQKDYEGRIEQLSKSVQSLIHGNRQQEIAGNITKDVATLQGEKELDPKSPEYIKGLEEDIVGLYHKLDFDEQSGSYRGNYSIVDIGKSLIEAARKAKSVGSLQAQTVVKDKSEGRVRTAPKVDVEAESDDLTPSASIAKGISKLFR